MFNSTIQTVSSAATVMIGTAFLAISAVAIASPARAEAPVGFQKAVESSIDNALDFPAGNATRKGVVTVAVTVAADGTLTAASVAKSSGVKAFDVEAVRAAKRVRYPATGKTQTVALVLGFGKQATIAETVQGQQIVDAMRVAQRNDARRLLATETTAQPAG
jgi:TonB family protein